MVPWTPLFQFLLVANVAWAVAFLTRGIQWNGRQRAGLAMILVPFLHLLLQVAFAVPRLQADVVLAPLDEADIQRNVAMAVLYRIALPLLGLGLVFEGVRRRALRFLHVPRASLRTDLEDGQALVAAVISIYVVGYFLIPLALGRSVFEQAEAPLSEISMVSALMLSLSAGMGEELLFRGILQRWLLRRLPWSFAVAAQAGLFGLSHATYASLVPVVGATALGLLTGLVAARLGLVAAILLHTQLDLLHFALDLSDPALFSVVGVAGALGLIFLVLHRARPFKTLFAPLPDWRQRTPPDDPL